MRTQPTRTDFFRTLASKPSTVTRCTCCNGVIKIDRPLVDLDSNMVSHRGYVWRVTPALHSPLMAVTNAVSSVIIVGAILAAGPAEIGPSKILGFCAVVLASVNIFGGFIVTQRMLAMFKKKGK